MPRAPMGDGVTGVRPDPATVMTRAGLTAALNTLRERRGLSVRDLARLTGSPVATVGGYLSGRHLPPVAQAALFRAMVEQCGVSDPDELDAWWAAVGRIRRAGRGRVTADEPAPYRGLAAFEATDSGWFFGRDALVEQALAHIRQPSPTAGRMLAVVGASGSGKSSLVRAGIVPAVTGTRRPGSTPEPQPPAFDRVILLVPGQDPLGALTTAVAEGPEAAGPSEAAASDTAADDGAAEADAAVRRQLRATLVSAPDRLVPPRTLVVIDQFEELFSGQVTDDQRSDFLQAVCALATTGGPAAPGPWVIFTLRADFYAAAAAHPHLLTVLSDAQLLVGAMSRDELRAAIERPAELAGLQVDGDLVERVLRDMTPRGTPGGTFEAGALPLMSHALQATWMRSRQHLTLADYLASGGIDSAVAQSAEDAVRDLDAEELTAVQRLFLRLVDVADGTTVTRRPSELADLPGSVTETILDRLTAARLLTTDRSTVQISHEALLAAWPRLRTWIELSRADIRLHRQLGDAASQWSMHDRDPSYLLHGSRLELVRAWLTDRADTVDLSPLEARFLADSESVQARDRSIERRRRRRGRVLVAVLAAVAVVASGLAVVGVQMRDAAAAQTDLTDRVQALLSSSAVLDAANRVRQTDANLAAQLSLVADGIAPTAATRSAVLDATAQPLVTRILGPIGPTMQALSPDGSTLAVSDAGTGSVRLFSVADREHPILLGTAATAVADQQFSLTFLRDGTMLAAGDSKGRVQRWDVRDPGAPRSLGAPVRALPSGVLGLVPTPDGQRLFAGGEGGVVKQWLVDADGGLTDQADIPAPSLVHALAVSPDGSTLAVGGRSSAVSLWSIGDTPAARGEIAVGADDGYTTWSLAYSPNGESLAVGGRDGTLQIWSTGDSPTQAPTPALSRFDSWVNVLGFSPDGRTFGAGSSDGTARLWSTADWSPAGSRGQPGPVTGLSIGATVLATSAADGTTRLSSVTGPRVHFPGSVFSVSWGATDSQLLVGPGGQANAVYGVDARRAMDPVVDFVATAEQPLRYAGGSATSPDGRVGAATTPDGPIQLWRLDDWTTPRPGAVLTGPTALTQQVIFSPDGTRLAAAVDDGSVWLWDVSNPDAPRLLSALRDLGAPMYSVAFSPTAPVLAAGGTSGHVLLWSLDDPTAPRQLADINASDGYVLAVAISPDGRVLTASGADRQVHRWTLDDPAAPALLGTALTGPTNDVYWLDYRGDGSLLAAASTDGTVWLWDATTGGATEPWATVTTNSGPLFTAEFSPDGSRLAAGGTSRAVDLWSVDPQEAAATICAAVGAPLTEAEWDLYVRDRPYAPPCR